jgi:hypothetical protein
MSSSEALARLKNWQRASKALVCPSVTFKTGTRLFEVRVSVLSVDESTLVLSNLEPPHDTEALDLAGVTFSSDEFGVPDLRLTFPDGKSLYLIEEE